MRYIYIYIYIHTHTHVCESAKGMSYHFSNSFLHEIRAHHFGLSFLLRTKQILRGVDLALWPYVTCYLEDKIYNETQRFKCVQRLLCAE